MQSKCHVGDVDEPGGGNSIYGCELPAFESEETLVPIWKSQLGKAGLK